jgi:hypothetical protein
LAQVKKKKKEPGAIPNSFLLTDVVVQENSVPSPILRADYKFTNLIILQYEEKQIYRERNGAGGQAV